MKGYDELFELRGGAYDRAMRQWPGARAQEFAQLIGHGGIRAGMRVADVPAGGGYLAPWLPEGSHWLPHEPCADFQHHGAGAAKAMPVPLLPLPWADGAIDVALSLAGIHHISDKRPLFAELRRVVRPGGRLVVSDVSRGSAVAGFLDDFVGAHNSTGHEGVFLDEATLDDLAACGWTVEGFGEEAFHWVFDDEDSMGAFCHQLFDLRSVTPTQTAEAIGSRLGIDRLDDGRVGMRWSLMTVRAVR